MLRMGGDQKCALITKKWTFYIFFLEKEGKGEKEESTRERRRHTARGSSLRAEESTLHGKAWGGHHYTKINSFSASSPESLDLLPW